MRKAARSPFGQAVDGNKTVLHLVMIKLGSMDKKA
jgi:hypothetical protein